MPSKKKNAALDAANIKGGNGKQNARRDEKPTLEQNSIPGGTCREKRLLISNLLQRGSDNGLTITDLVRLTGLDERIIRRRINRERRDGILIISDNVHGYFLAENVEEVRRFIRSMSRRAREIIAVCWAVEDGLAKMEGQETLFEGR